MADKVSKEVRSRNMSRIRCKDTKPEIKVRKYLYHQGFRYRKNVKDLPGKPDIYIKKYNTVIFVNGCFWHQHYNCKYATVPKTNVDFWTRKLERNVHNDDKNIKSLKQMGFNVVVIWECELKNKFEFRMNQLIEEIRYLEDCDEE